MRQMELREKIECWLSEADYSDARRVLLIDLFKDFVCWHYKHGEDMSSLTVQALSSELVAIGYNKVHSYSGVYFIIKHRNGGAL